MRDVGRAGGSENERGVGDGEIGFGGEWVEEEGPGAGERGVRRRDGEEGRSCFE